MTAKKRLLPILVAVLMVFAMMPITAGTVFAEGEDIYTVTVQPGEGGGTAFTVSSTTILSYSDMFAGNYDGKKGCFYRYDGEDAVWYRFPTECPFAAPDGKEFDCWKCSTGVSLGAGTFFPIADHGIITITALWKDQEAHSTADITIPSSVNVQYGDTQTAFDIQVDSLTYINTDDVFNITLFDSVFTNANNEIIPFTVSCNGLDATRNNNAGWTKIVIWPGGQPEYPYTYQGFINIRSEDLSNASPGSYSVSLRYTYRFGDTEEEGTIALSLTVPGGQPPVENCTVTFDAAGGTWTDGTTANKEVTVEKGQAATAPDVPTRDGFTFDGWDPEDFSNITSNLTVTAQWIENSEPQPQPAAQTITASNLTKTYGNAAFSLGAKTNGDGTLTYKSSNTKVVTVDSAGKVTIKGAGTAKITISVSATANYKAATKTITVTVKQAANPLKMSPKTAAVKHSKLKKKTQTLAVTKVIKFTKKLNDKKTYTLVSAKKGSKSFKKYFKINKITGKVTIKKNKKMKKGTYKVKVKVKALGNSNYNASAVKTVTFKVKVK